MKIEFNGNSFCFTGGLAELKRTQAEREVRARNGFSQSVINRELNYLVIGSIPSAGWKQGNYGNKIIKARQLIKEGASLTLISEKEFMLSLENTVAMDSGEIDEKLLIIRYSALFLNGDIDITELEDYLNILKDTPNLHISASIEEPFIYKDLYNEYSEQDIEDLLIFQCRIVKHCSINSETGEFIDNVSKGFESIKGLDGKLTWNEKKEGTASFAKLLQDIPVKTKLT
jgi:hypothetical protein